MKKVTVGEFLLADQVLCWLWLRKVQTDQSYRGTEAGSGHEVIVLDKTL